MNIQWDPRFEELLREFLPLMTADETLDQDTDLRDAGLDSIGTIELLGRIEDEYQVRFVGEALTMATFATPEVLWATVIDLSEAAA